MQSFSPFSYLSFLFILTTLSFVKTQDGFCSAPSSSILDADSNSQPLYWKVSNPTLSPSHLQGFVRNNFSTSQGWVKAYTLPSPDSTCGTTLDLPGFTRSVYKRDHAFITPESQVFSPLPDWKNTLGAYLITPAIGSHFVMYLAKMQENSKSGLPPRDVERFIFVVQGIVVLTNISGNAHKLTVDSYAYLPPNLDHTVETDAAATLVVFERRYSGLEGHVAELIVGSTDKQPLLETPGEIFELRKLLPTSLAYDFNIHIMDFQPGEFLNVKEVHYNQHGLLLLEGQGIYRLSDSWYPIQAGDAIWMAPFVPQWYAALGKTRSRYLLYKDVNRNPL
ncbi:(S)-ureidoglycine aminohydrolase [Capsicum annuum]|nr:(S)-ureidoglycine aminohydrolase [Capsicum annuum]